MIMKLKSDSAQDTEKIGQQLGSRLKGSETLVLSSDLGGGKTTFVTGLVAGAGSKDTVASPSFTISRIYESPVLSIHHFDFYRLKEPGIMIHEIEEVLKDPRAVLVIEWSDIVNHILPAKKLKIEFRVTGENSRELELNYPKSLSYLINGHDNTNN